MNRFSKFEKGALALVALAVALPVLPAQAQMPSSAKKELIHQSLLKCYEATHRNAEAEGEYVALLAIKPSDPVFHYNYAVLLQRSGRKGPALMHYRKAAQLDPSNVDFHGVLGQMLLVNGDYGGAYNELGKAIQMPGGDRYKGAFENATRYKQQADANRMSAPTAKKGAAAAAAKKNADDDDE
jgi:Tfp pilus assembly protein PilF